MGGLDEGHRSEEYRAPIIGVVHFSSDNLFRIIPSTLSFRRQSLLPLLSCFQWPHPQTPSLSPMENSPLSTWHYPVDVDVVVIAFVVVVVVVVVPVRQRHIYKFLVAPKRVYKSIRGYVRLSVCRYVL